MLNLNENELTAYDILNLKYHKVKAYSQRNYDFVMAFGRLFRDGMKPTSARDEYFEAGQKLMRRFLDGEDPYPK